MWVSSVWVFPVGGGRGDSRRKRGGESVGDDGNWFYLYAKMGFQNRDSALDTLS